MAQKLDLSRTDLNLLVVFETVFATRHVGRAAGELSLSPSAVSHGLGRLRRMFNDPLFLRTPKGVVPTERARDLAPHVAEVLEGVRRVVEAGTPFDPAASVRKFTLGTPDAEATLAVPTLPRTLARLAPNVGLSVRTVMPFDMLDELDAGRIDVAVTPYVGEVPKRFHLEALHQQDFVVAMARGHPGAERPDLDWYCRQSHAVMSLSGDTQGFIDEALAGMGRSRRVALTMPSFLSILAALEGTGLVAAAPRSMVARHADRFGLSFADLPVELETSTICAVTTRAAMADAGVAWLLGVLRGLYP